MRSISIVLPLVIALAATGVAHSQSAPMVVLRESMLLPSTPASKAQYGWYGYAVAIEGDLAAVGAREAWNPAGCGAGAVFVYERSGNQWIESAALHPPNGCDADDFGHAVAISSGRVFVGAPGTYFAGPLHAGAVFVYERQGSTWVLAQELHGTTPFTGRQLGRSIAADGDTLLVGAAPDFGNYSNTGEAIVFTRSVTGWTQQSRLHASDGQVNDRFGWSVALEGGRAVVAAISDEAARGSLYVFQSSSGGWIETAKLLCIPSGGGPERLGWSLDLDGDRIAAGATLTMTPYPSPQGAVYVFELAPGGWSQTARVTAPGGASGASMFGISVALEGDRLLGGTLHGRFNTFLTAGNVHVFERAGSGNWDLTQVLGASTLENSSGFGWSTAFDGERVIVGAITDDTALSPDSGAAYTFVLDPVVASYCTAKLNSLGCLPAIGWSGTPSMSSSAPFSITASNVINQKSGMLFYGFEQHALPYQGGTLCVATPLQRTPPQSSGGSLTTVDCSGSYTFDFNALLRSGQDPDLHAGVEVLAQWWYRDPAGLSPIGLTDALRAHIRL